MTISKSKNDALSLWRLPVWQNKFKQDVAQQKTLPLLACGSIQSNEGLGLAIIYQRTEQLPCDEYVSSLLKSFLSGTTTLSEVREAQQRHEHLVIYLGVQSEQHGISCADTTTQLYIPHGVEKIMNHHANTQDLLRLCWQTCL